MGWKKTDSYIASFIGRMTSNIAAVTSQSYDEVNKKLGKQWELSRSLSMDKGDTNYLVIKTGQYPVDLKKLEFAYTGYGFIVNIYISPQYTGGVNETVYSLRHLKGSLETQMISGVTLVDDNKGEQCGATIYAMGNTTSQGHGNSGAQYATNRILEPNSEYLLEIISLHDQGIASRMEFYEGPLDFN